MGKCVKSKKINLGMNHKTHIINLIQIKLK